MEVNTADRETLLRVPGIGTVSARRILCARRGGPLSHQDLQKLGVVMKRAQYFITCKGKFLDGLKVRQESILQGLLWAERAALPISQGEQLSLFHRA